MWKMKQLMKKKTERKKERWFFTNYRGTINQIHQQSIYSMHCLNISFSLNYVCTPSYTYMSRWIVLHITLNKVLLHLVSHEISMHAFLFLSAEAQAWSWSSKSNCIWADTAVKCKGGTKQQLCDNKPSWRKNGKHNLNLVGSRYVLQGWYWSCLQGAKQTRSPSSSSGERDSLCSRSELLQAIKEKKMRNLKNQNRKLLEQTLLQRCLQSEIFSCKCS